MRIEHCILFCEKLIFQRIRWQVFEKYILSCYFRSLYEKRSVLSFLENNRNSIVPIKILLGQIFYFKRSGKFL
jgi:hypothetical protein